MKKLYVTLALVSFVGISLVQAQSGFRVDYQPYQSGSSVQDKPFYLLTVMSKMPGLRQVLTKTTDFQRIGQQKQRQLLIAVQTGGEESAAYVDAVRWSPTDINAVGQTLARLYAREPLMQTLVQQHLRPCGHYERWNTLSDTALLSRAWQLTAEGLNRVLEVYGLGQKPRYPAIDSVSYDPHSLSYRKLIRITASVLAASSDTAHRLFFTSTLDFALALLDINNRDEAGRYEPLRQGQNKLAVERMKHIHWADYPYSTILVLGAGPDIANSGIDGWGKMRLRLAVERFRAGKAPFLMVSGGNVHPFQTPFNEAVELKKELMQQYQIPESAILVEPYARHTTTNIRNANRLLYHYGVPGDKPVLVTTDMYQSRYIETPLFKERCQQELGYPLVKELTRLSSYDLTYFPIVESLTIDSTDALDP